ncbi:MAG: hypothetical protein QMD88_06975 [Coprothermobacterota bacterium]|nr:hypothetical protein [Coprothermobacterota bacterium]
MASLSCGLATAKVILPTHPAPPAPGLGNASALGRAGQTQPPQPARAGFACLDQLNFYVSILSQPPIQGKSQNIQIFRRTRNNHWSYNFLLFFLLLFTT